ncbi:MAG: lycopene cyclase domain-containing protein [bacterium]|nr:lycopene cyclase domain-containing protein [bacterium]
MTYGGFLFLFVVPPLLAVLWRHGWALHRRGWAAMALLLVIVYASTTAWDNAAVAMGLWGFDPQRVWGPHLWYLPVEEYAFFGLQTLLTGVWVQARLARALGRAGAR